MKLTQQQVETIISQVKASISDCWAIYVFGSFASGTATESSDVDIAVLCFQPVQADVLVSLIEGLSVSLNRAIDVVDMRTANDVLNMEIIQKGVQISVAELHKYETELFASHKFSDYVRLNHYRNEILKDIKQRGSIYG